MISTANAGYRRWLHDDGGVYFAPPYLTSASQFGGSLSFGPQAPSPKATRHILTPASLLLALKEDDSKLKAWQPATGSTYQWDTLPEEPLPDDPNVVQPPAPPPPRSCMQDLPGYEKVGAFGESLEIPPSSSKRISLQVPKFKFDQSWVLNEEQVKNALVQHVGDQCCYGDGAAKNMEVLRIKQSSSFQYTLETFTELRSAGYKDRPYKGGDVDGPQNGPPPSPWSIKCTPEKDFHNAVKKLEVPHTAVVKQCHHCQGLGFNRCFRCQGLGWVRCNHCNGGGQVYRNQGENSHYDYCNFCGGDGKRKCFTCNVEGRITCNRCRGFRDLKCYVELTVVFTNHSLEFVQDDPDIPEELRDAVSRVTILEQKEPRVHAITGFHQPELNEASTRLIKNHRTSLRSEKYLSQRQIVKVLPVTVVWYRWKGKERKIWLYGKDNKVHWPGYPHSCCWGCTVL